jgi:hypothetical protein
MLSRKFHKMLALDDKRWALLSHAYGNADYIPEMILQLLQDFESEQENDLFYGCLCHQYSTYSATFAAVPHIVEIAFRPRTKTKNQSDIVIFCGLVHAYRNYDRRYKINSVNHDFIAELNAQIETAYYAAIEKIKPLAENLFKENQVDGEVRRLLFFSFLAFQGQEKLSRMFFQYSDLDEFVFDCPNCENEIYLWAEGKELVAFKQDPIFIRKFNKEPVKFDLSPAKIEWKDWNGEFSDEEKAKWILQFAEKYNIEMLKHQLPYLFSQMFCPHCNHLINIVNSLENFISL